MAARKKPSKKAPASRKAPVKKSAAKPAKARPSKQKAAPPVPPAPVVDPITASRLVAPPGPVSKPGEPSAHPDRAPVPARPSIVQQVFSPSMVGRQVAPLSLYRDPPVQEGGAEIDMCAGCDVDCCSGHVIPINAFDAWRIRSVLNVPFRDFLGLVPADAAAPTHAVRIGGQRFTMVLKRREDRSCGFLIKLGNERRCGIHGLRPDACRIFPFLPDEEMQRAQEGNTMLQMHPAHCPWRWPSTAEHKARVLQDIQDNVAHRKMDRELLTRWFWAIGVPKTVDAFFQFLEDELPRVMLRPDEPSKYMTSLW